MSLHQVRMLNIAHETWLGCTDENDSLLTTLDSCTAAFGAYNDAISSLRYQVQLQQMANQQKLQVIDTLQGVITNQKKTIKQLKVHRTLSTIGEGVLGAIIIWILLR